MIHTTIKNIKIFKSYFRYEGRFNLKNTNVSKFNFRPIKYFI